MAVVAQLVDAVSIGRVDALLCGFRQAARLLQARQRRGRRSGAGVPEMVHLRQSQEGREIAARAGQRPRGFCKATASGLNRAGARSCPELGRVSDDMCPLLHGVFLSNNTVSKEP